MTNPSAPTPAHRHALEEDPARLEHIVDVMWAEIHKVLRRRPPRRRRTGGSDVTGRIGDSVSDELIAGSISAEEILSDSLASLLQTPESAVTTSWEALAVGIARNKAKGALRDSQAWLRGTANRPRLTVVSGDEPRPQAGDYGPGAPPFEGLADPGVDLDQQFMKTSQQLELVRLAREILSDRDRTIFLGRHFGTQTRESLADQFRLTPPGVTHVYRTTAKRLYDHPRFQRFAEGGAP